MATETKSRSQMLQQRCLAIAGVATQDDKPYTSLADISKKRFLKRRIDVCLRREVSVKTACFAVSPSRAWIRLQQREEPRDALFTEFGRRSGSVCLIDRRRCGAGVVQALAHLALWLTDATANLQRVKGISNAGEPLRF